MDGSDEDLPDDRERDVGEVDVDGRDMLLDSVDNLVVALVNSRLSSELRPVPDFEYFRCTLRNRNIVTNSRTNSRLDCIRIFAAFAYLSLASSSSFSADAIC